MPLFMPDDELKLLSNDATTVAEKADLYIRELYAELETVKAKADAAAITAEQTCSLLEQKYISLSQEFASLESQNAQLQSSMDGRLSELAQSQSEKHQLHLQSIGNDGEIERLTIEVSELHKSKRQLMEMLEQKDIELREKNSTITSYLDKLINLTDNSAQKETRLSEAQAELARSQAACAHLSQEKELIERHNVWLNEELTAKVDTVIELRRVHGDLEADMSAKLTDTERQLNVCSSSLNWHKERLRELDTKLASLQEELCSSKDAAAAIEKQFSAELSTANKLVDLYRESSEEWSRKSGDLEGVIKALETHLSHVENNYKERLEKEAATTKQLEMETKDLKEKLEKCEAEIETSRKANELNLLPLSSFTRETFDANQALVPHIPAGVSGTALATSLLRDGWSLAKMYEKYQEAIDAQRHEQLGRKESELILQRVLCELEEKAGLIMDERAEYERIVEAYSLVNQKLLDSTSEQSNLEKTILNLKADLRRYERENRLSQKEVVDLQKQVTVLLKECRDIQLRCGISSNDDTDEMAVTNVEMNMDSDADKVISENLLMFKDINGLVEQNAKLRSLVRNLSEQIDSREMEFKEKMDIELKKKSDEAASKVSVVLERAEEQARMIESLHTSVAMYKRLYEEEQKHHSSHSRPADVSPENGRKDILLLLEGSQDANRKAKERSSEQVKILEEELAKTRIEIIALRSERDKLALSANFAREKLDSIIKETEHQREEANAIIARNVEFSQLIVDYQRKLRESSESLNSTEERSRMLSMEVSVLKSEKEMLSNAEKRASSEVCSLSERVYRLQASLDTIQSAEEVREEARVADRKKQEEYIKQIEREWAEAKKELQEERSYVRNLTSDREQTLKSAMKQVEEMGKELANALQAVTAAESRAAIAETRLLDVEKKTMATDAETVEVGSRRASLANKENAVELRTTEEELEKWKGEAEANKNHMLQYKSIAQVNETALKQMESAHENFKIEAEKLQKTLEAELLLLRERVSELEIHCNRKSEEAFSASAGKEEALTSALAEISSLNEQNLIKISHIEAMEVQFSTLKRDLEAEHEKWRVSQANYERQVILQSDTIQELTKTSQALATLQEEASELRKLADSLKTENTEFKDKWKMEKAMLQEQKHQAEKKYDELNEQNKLLHTRLEALHIQLAEKNRSSSGLSSSGSTDESGLQTVVNYLRRTKEIAETEISLLKQEKLRLRSQLENALKAAETAQLSLNAERTNSRASLLTDEQIRSLQLQVTEMNLLRESNIQLREENKHNFDECQKLRESAQKARIECETMENLLKQRQVEIETCKREIEIQRIENEKQEKRVSELLERSRNIDLADYDRLKDEALQMKGKLKEKDSEIEGVKNLLSEKQSMISQLEQDLAKIKLELHESENKSTNSQQVETTLKSEVEKQKRIILQCRRRIDTLAKEKGELSKENQALTKQLEELKQSKRSVGATATTVEQVMKDKEEKEQKLQLLEKTLKRHTDEWKKREDELKSELKRKEDETKRMEDDFNKKKATRMSSEKAFIDSLAKVNQEKTNIESELEKHKPAVKRLINELEKLKQAEGNLPEGTLVGQILDGPVLNDHYAAYVSAVEHFESVAHSVAVDLGSHSHPTDVGVNMSTPAPVISGRASPIKSSVPLVTTNLPAKATENRDKRSIMPKTKAETRKPLRRLVRPQGLARPEEPQGDVEISEPEGANNAVKSTLSYDAESQGNITFPPALRKRMATSSVSELQQGSPDLVGDFTAPGLKKAKGLDVQAEGTASYDAESQRNITVPPTVRKRVATSSVSELQQGSPDIVGDVSAPVLKKAKGLDVQAESAETQSVVPAESLVTQSAVDDPLDAGGELLEGSNEDTVDAEKEEIETIEESKESQQVDGINEAEFQPENDDIMEEALESPIPSEMVTDEGARDQTDQDGLDIESDREDGEFEAEVATDLEGGADVTYITPSPEGEEGELEPSLTPTASPARMDEEGEDLSDALNDEGEGVEEATDDKSTIIANEQLVGESSKLSDAASDDQGIVAAPDNLSQDPDVSEQAPPSAAAETEEKQASPLRSSTPTIVNLSERARQRSAIRQAEARAGISGATQGRGRVAPGRVVRGRGAATRGRAGRQGRGPSSAQ